MRTLVTRVAHAGRTDHKYFGHDVLADLLGVETLTGLVAMAVTGRRPSDDEKELLDALAVSVTAADPRIWPLKVTRIVGSYGEMLAGFAAGQLAMLGTYISPRIITGAAEQLQQLRGALVGADERSTDTLIREHITRNVRLGGYGVPLRAQDERFVALTEYMRRKDRAGLPHWRAQEALSRIMWEEHELRPNIGIGLPAAMLDLGYTPAQCGSLSTFLLEQDHAANAIEAAAQRAPEMQRLPVECVDYVGTPARRSPRATAQDQVRTRREAAHAEDGRTDARLGAE
jgi:hypothetical protein